MKAHAIRGAGLAFAFALGVSLALPYVGATAAESGFPDWPAFLARAFAIGAGAGTYVFVILRLGRRGQQVMAWLTLCLLFLAFFASFDLDLPFVVEKLPYLLTAGLGMTVFVSLVSIAFAFVLALATAVAKLSGNGIAEGIGGFYTSFFRGVPLLMLLFLVYVGLPQIGYVVDSLPAGILALALCYGAYMAEIFRAGITSIPIGQWEASDALGLSRRITFLRVILPQSMRLIIPPTGNQFISMLKDSSLVSTVGVWDLMYVARAQGRSEFKVLEMLIAASLIYWVMSIILEIAQARLERHFTPVDRGYSKSAEI
jgi:polar amino acid transport system permease protein